MRNRENQDFQTSINNESSNQELASPKSAEFITDNKSRMLRITIIKLPKHEISKTFNAIENFPETALDDDWSILLTEEPIIAKRETPNQPLMIRGKQIIEYDQPNSQLMLIYQAQTKPNHIKIVKSDEPSAAHKSRKPAEILAFDIKSKALDARLNFGKPEITDKSWNPNEMPANDESPK
jgi:hypothetical protein